MKYCTKDYNHPHKKAAYVDSAAFLCLFYAAFQTLFIRKEGFMPHLSGTAVTAVNPGLLFVENNMPRCSAAGVLIISLVRAWACIKILNSERSGGLLCLKKIFSWGVWRYSL
jgi:hypothetical protein